MTLHNAEAERALLGAVLVAGPEVWEGVQDVPPSAFFLLSNRTIWAALVSLAQAGQGQDIISVKNWLDEHKQLAEVGGPAYLAELLSGIPNVFSAGQYAQIVRAQAAKREALRLLQSAYQAVTAANGNLDDITGRAAAALDGLASRQTSHIWAGEAGWEWYEAVKRYSETGIIPGLSTGYQCLDRNTHGLKRGQICILAGRPSMGKSALAFQIAYRQARAGLKVGIVSLEMVRGDVAGRIALAECNLDKHNLTPAGVEQLAERLGELDTLPLVICDTPGLSAIQVGGEARAMRRTLGGLDVLVVDHLGYIDHPAGDNMNIRLGLTMKALTRTAKELDVALLVLCQLNRGVTERAIKEPDLPDLRESGHIEQDARAVWMLHRAGYYKPIDEQPNKAEPQKAVVLIRKNHDGPRGLGVPLAFIEQSARFAEWTDIGELPDGPYPFDH